MRNLIHLIYVSNLCLPVVLNRCSWKELLFCWSFVCCIFFDCPWITIPTIKITINNQLQQLWPNDFFLHEIFLAFVTRPLWRHALLNRSLLLLDVRRFIKFLTGCLVQSLLNTLFADILYLQTFLKVSNLQFDVGKVTINCVCDLCKRCKYFFIKKTAGKECWRGLGKQTWRKNASPDFILQNFFVDSVTGLDLKKNIGFIPTKSTYTIGRKSCVFVHGNREGPIVIRLSYVESAQNLIWKPKKCYERIIYFSFNNLWYYFSN